MGSIHYSLPIEAHQHPAIGWLHAVTPRRELNLVAFEGTVTNSLSKRHHVHIDTQSDHTELLLSFFYGARGAWLPDVKRYLHKFPGIVEEDLYELCGDNPWHRVQLCGHESSTANCNWPKEMADRVITTALDFLRRGDYPPHSTEWMNIDGGWYPWRDTSGAPPLPYDPNDAWAELVRRAAGL